MAKLNMAYVKFKKPAKLLSSYLPFKNQQKLLSSYLPLKPAKLLSSYLPFKKPAKLLSSYLPVSPSRVLRAPGTSPYHLVPKHLRTTWSGPEQSHLLSEACSPNGTDKRRQRQRQTERPPPDPATFLRDFVLYMTTNYAIIRKWCLNINPLTVLTNILVIIRMT